MPSNLRHRRDYREAAARRLEEAHALFVVLLVLRCVARGVLPSVPATGAGAASRQAIGTAVFYRTFKEVKRLNIGQGGSNVGFSKDGKTAFIAVTRVNAVAVIDVEKLALASQIKAGKEPQGLIVR